MTRRTFFSTFIALVALALAMLCTDTTVASAQQNPNCCTYTVDIQNLFPPCDQIRLSTRWDCPPIFNTIKSYTGNGIFVEPLNPAGGPPCPPACKLIGISLDNVNFIGPNQTKQYKIGNCCYILSFGFDANGCIYIKITKC